MAVSVPSRQRVWSTPVANGFVNVPSASNGGNGQGNTNSRSGVSSDYDSGAVAGGGNNGDQNGVGMAGESATSSVCGSPSSDSRTRGGGYILDSVAMETSPSISVKAVVRSFSEPKYSDPKKSLSPPTTKANSLTSKMINSFSAKGSPTSLSKTVTAGHVTRPSSPASVESDGSTYSYMSVKRANQKIADLEIELKEVMSQLQRARQDVAKLSRELEQSHTAKGFVDAAANEATSTRAYVERELISTKKRVEELSRNLDATQAALIETAGEKVALERELVKKQREAVDTSRCLREALEALEDAETSKTAVHAELSEYRRALEDVQNQGTEKVATYRKALYEVDVERKEVMEQLDKLQGEFKSAREELRRREEVVEAQERELQKLREEHRDATSEMTMVKSLLNEMRESQKKQADSGVAVMTAELAATSTRQHEAEVAIVSLQDALRESRKEVTGVREKMMEVERRAADLEREKMALAEQTTLGTRRVEELLSKLASVQRGRVEMEDKAKAAENDVRNATEAEKKAKAALAEMENRYRMTLRDSETKAAILIRGWEERVMAAEAEVAAAKAKEAEVVAEMEVVRRELRAERGRGRSGSVSLALVEDGDASGASTELTKRLDESETEARALRVEVELLTNQIRELERRIADGKEKEKLWEEKARVAEDEIAELRVELQEAKQKESKAVSKLKEAEAAKRIAQETLLRSSKQQPSFAVDATQQGDEAKPAAELEQGTAGEAEEAAVLRTVVDRPPTRRDKENALEEEEEEEEEEGISPKVRRGVAASKPMYSPVGNPAANAAVEGGTERSVPHAAGKAARRRGRCFSRPRLCSKAATKKSSGCGCVVQ
ncbi:hypothetical protein CBR_g21750 [Chara braunii]|uniref:Uncharacterized protein n=1 Tax=Chara braunii TaxID=69332 RepID=A0A388L1A4_CHABU|nr:hypothetical protein CBR_g21750 [Chara braunii]|eukprot:GBG76090.1 hypothetical protein CBR_g21750 [Chara braunii]